MSGLSFYYAFVAYLMSGMSFYDVFLTYLMSGVSVDYVFLKYLMSGVCVYNIFDVWSVSFRCVFNIFDVWSVILRTVFNVFDVWSVILRCVFDIFDAWSVILSCVLQILDVCSIILRCVFNIIHEKPLISYNVFVKSFHFVQDCGGHFSKSTCFFVGGTPRNRMQQRTSGTSTLHMRVRTLTARRMFKEKQICESMATPHKDWIYKCTNTCVDTTASTQLRLVQATAKGICWTHPPNLRFVKRHVFSGQWWKVKLVLWFCPSSLDRGSRSKDPRS